MADPVERRLALQASRHDAFAALVVELLAPFAGDERALDVGCGTGALAYVLAEHVREVVGVDESEAFIEAARRSAPPGCTFVVADATSLPFPYGDFDLVGCVRVLHHVRRPELVVSELARVARPGGRILLVDQLGDVDPIRSLELDRFERARDPTHTRLLPDADIRGYLDANDLTVVANRIVSEHRDMETYLDLVDLESEARERVARMAPASYDVELGWYVAVKHG
jgi:ubiquinone/menaquinone biosynthesis C-methylase UbiE